MADSWTPKSIEGRALAAAASLLDRLLATAARSGAHAGEISQLGEAADQAAFDFWAELDQREARQAA